MSLVQRFMDNFDRGKADSHKSHGDVWISGRRFVRCSGTLTATGFSTHACPPNRDVHEWLTDTSSRVHWRVGGAWGAFLKDDESFASKGIDEY
jgi:hypothetical protein